MDRTKPRSEKRRKNGLVARVAEAVRLSVASRKKSAAEPLSDALVFAAAFLFARCHIVFGAFPLALALLCALPCRVWIASLGAVAGALTLGKYGIIYAMISVIAVFLRVVVSGGEKEEGVPRLFSESLLLRMSSAVISGFVAAVYEILLSGFSLSSVLFGLSMIILPALLCFAFSGVFDAGISLGDIFLERKSIFGNPLATEKERYNLIFFQCAALLFAFFVSLSLGEYELLGINAAYIFASMLTIFVSRRFGPLRAAAIGFASSLGLSGTAAAALALSGLASGILFRLGIVYALLGGAIALSLWGAYSGGLLGLLAVLPEYSVAAMLSLPLIRRASPERTEKEIEKSERSAADMVGTMTLSYKSRSGAAMDALISSLASVSASIKKRSASELLPKRDELCDLVFECTRRYCDGCDAVCEACLRCGGATKIFSDPDAVAIKLAKQGKISEDTLGDAKECKRRTEIAETVNRAAALLSEKKYKEASKNGSATEIDQIAKLVSEAREADERERRIDEELSARLTELLCERGMDGGVARVFGSRRRHIILAAEDEDGSRISSKDFLLSVEGVLGASLAAPEFYRRGGTALLECSTVKSYAVECAYAALTGEREDISGDTARAFESRDGSFFALISDGMGSGEEAKETSELVSELLFGALGFSSGKETAVKLLNNIILSRPGECSATVDLFALDLYLGEACFIKSGAAASFVKRHREGAQDSLFRIRSSTAPIGLMREVDAERIRVDVESGDYIIMMSDGVTDGAEDAPWLLETLSGEVSVSVKEYAEKILLAARKNRTTSDDMTVLVVKIKRA